MEELLVDKMKLERIIGSVGKELTDEEIKKKYPLVPELGPVVEHLSRLVSDIQYQVMQARLVPVEQIFARFPRMVRDLAAEQNKEIEFEVSGGEIELDRTIIDKLGEPLVHLLKNAVDHGIESAGTVSLQARREREYAVIVVEDDGQGVDFEAVRRAAQKRNITTAESEVNILNKDHLVNLLYHPRLSTKEQVTETSGRGVGMSVVKDFVSNIGGRVYVESPIATEAESGGTRITLELPLTLAIINSLLVTVNGAMFAIPFSSVERSVSVEPADIKSMADQDVALVDGRDVALVRLGNIFGLTETISGKTAGQRNRETEKLKDREISEDPRIDPRESASATSTIVLVKRGNEMAGIVVDTILDEQEIIVKTLPPVLRGVKGFSGSTILGDGRTVLILDPVSLLEDSSRLVRV